MQMGIEINWPYMFLFLAWLIPAILVKTRKEAISAMIVFLLVATLLVMFSDSNHTTEVVSARNQIQKYAPEMQTLGVQSISIHANLLISDKSYSSLSALKDGYYYDDMHIPGMNNTTKGPQPTTAFDHYTLHYLYKALTLLSCMDVFSHKVVEMTIRDGKAYLAANSAVLKQIGPENIGRMMDTAASLHLPRLSAAEGKIISRQ